MRTEQDGPMPIADEPFEAEITNSEVVFNGAVWDIRRDTLDYNGHEMRREYMAHTGAVAIYAENEAGRVLVIQQYRHPVRLRDWELPAGLLDKPGEEPLEAAKRELAEEADLEADDWEPLVTFNSTPGGSDERLYVFRARGVRETSEPFEREAEEADIVKQWVPRSEIVEGALSGNLTNSILILSALAVDAKERG
jgi:ADP-ribose pyrophosphatase